MIYSTHGEGPDRGEQFGRFGDLAVTVDDAVRKLRPYLDRFDSIVVTGVSGIVVGSPVALALDKPLVVVRKENDGSHGSHRGREGCILGLPDLGTKACFLDDLVASGKTRRFVQESILPEAQVVMQYMYERNSITELMPYERGPSSTTEYEYYFWPPAVKGDDPPE